MSIAPPQSRCTLVGSAVADGARQASIPAVIEMAIETVTDTLRVLRCDMLGSLRKASGG